MTREEEIRKYAEGLGQKYFPNSRNIWARPNIEAQCVTSACIEMAKWADETMIEKACEWWEEKLLCAEDYYPTIEFLSIIEYNSLKELINDFRKSMEE